MAHYLRRLVAIWLCIVSAIVSAQTATPTNYEVEVIVFETQLPQLEGAEVWLSEGTTPVNTAGAVNMGTTPTTSALSTAAANLQASGDRHRVLAHKRWVQLGDTKEKATPVLLATNDGTLSGVLRFYVNRFSHIEVDLDYRPAIDDPMAPVYRMREQRRVKSQEANYFDHPKFGVIVRVAPAG